MDQPPKHLSPLTLNPSLLPVPPIDITGPKTPRSPGVPPAAKMAMLREQLDPLPLPQSSGLITNSKIKRINVWRNEIYSPDLLCVCSLSTSPETYSPAVSIISTKKGSIIHPNDPNALATQNSAALPAQEPCFSPASSVYSTSDILATSTQATSPLSSISIGFPFDPKQDLCPQCGAKRPETRPSSDDGDSTSKSRNMNANDSESTKAESPGHRRRNSFWNGVKMLARKYAGGAPAADDPKTRPASTHSGHPNNGLHLRAQTTPLPSPLSPEPSADPPSPRPVSQPAQTAKKRFNMAFFPIPPKRGKEKGHQRSESTSKALTPAQAYLQEAVRKSAVHRARCTSMYAELRIPDQEDARLKLLLGDKMMPGTTEERPNNTGDKKDPKDNDGEEWDIDELIAESEEERRKRRMIEIEKLGSRVRKKSKGLTLGRPVSFAGLGAKF